MKVTQHVSAFIEPDSPPFSGAFGTITELLKAPWVQAYWSAPGFHQFSRTPDGPAAFYLLAEFAGGKRYYVVARMEGSDVAGATRALSPWQGPIK